VLSHADLVTCLRTDVLLRACELAPATPIELLANPVTIDEDSPPAFETEELVLFAGEIGTRKGADILRDAWQQLAIARPQARCIMLGPAGDFIPGPARRLEIRPPAPASEITRLIRRARVVALPSRSEGMPMILTEAMSAGRPFVSTPVGAIPELAEHGGLLVPVADEQRLAQSLTRLLADPALAQRIGERGRAFCRRTRSLDVITAALQGLYAQAAQGRRARRRTRWDGR